MRTRILVLTTVAAALATGAASAKGPAPGVSSGPQGVVAPSGAIKYVAMGARGGGTVVRAITLPGRKIVRSRVVPGRYGIARVAFDGTAGGVSTDGATLVLPSLDRSAGRTRFAVVSTDTLRVRKVIELNGLFSYDAISPSGSILYLVEYLSAEHYRVRALNVATGGLYRAVVVDKAEAGEPMEGYPVTRATTRDGTWAFTLYGRAPRPAFVHALGTSDRIAVCVDLPWTVSRTALMHVRMSLEGTDLVLRDRAGRVGVVDAANGYKVRAIRKPR